MNPFFKLYAKLFTRSEETPAPPALVRKPECRTRQSDLTHWGFSANGKFYPFGERDHVFEMAADPGRDFFENPEEYIGWPLEETKLIEETK